MLEITEGSKVDRIRRQYRHRFIPGKIVRVKEHTLTTIIYDYIHLYAEPSNGGVHTSCRILVGMTAMIIGVCDLNDRWLLLLTSDGIMNWTFELEGLEILL